MARIFLTTLSAALVTVLVGCAETIEGKAQLIEQPTASSVVRAPSLNIAGATEMDLAEQVATNRVAYRQGLELLINYYTKTGNNMKLTWAQRELKALNATVKYRYIIQAEVAGPGLKATTAIRDADKLYQDALETYEKARFLIFADERVLRNALDKFNMLITKYPASDKIDDAAFKAARIYEHFQDYSISVLYYKRAFQWDENTTYPARCRAARILDIKLHKRDEALALYRQVVEKESQHSQCLEFAELRVEQLTKTAEER